MQLEYTDAMRVITQLGPTAPHQRKITADLALIANRIIAREQERTGESYEEVMARAWKDEPPRIDLSNLTDGEMAERSSGVPGQIHRAEECQIGLDIGVPGAEVAVQTDCETNAPVDEPKAEQ